MIAMLKWFSSLEEARDMRYRLIYGVLWPLTVVVYLMPWARVDGNIIPGCAFAIHYTVTYFIGILIGLIVLTTEYNPIPMTIIAGVLMIFGFIGGEWALSETAKHARVVVAEWGMVLSFFTSMIYMVAGAYIGKKMAAKKA